MYNFEILKETMMGMAYEEVKEAASRDAVVMFPLGVVGTMVRIFLSERIYLSA